ncbi:hypothetical protein H0W80_03515 [Candidatus Saccharibacteria bacterium]|nr:hypothetical protein [Candidatus Saccharibacteria bacterium]
MPTQVSFVVDDSEICAMELLTKIQHLKKVSFRGMTDISIKILSDPACTPGIESLLEKDVELLQKPIQELCLSRRTLNCLQHALLSNVNGVPERREDCDISTIGQLIQKTRREILAYFDIGPGRADEVEANLAQLGLVLKQENPT